MDTQLKQMALKDAVELSKVAFGTTNQNLATYTHPDVCAEFVDVLYHKLCSYMQTPPPASPRTRHWHMLLPVGASLSQSRLRGANDSPIGGIPYRP